MWNDRRLHTEYCQKKGRLMTAINPIGRENLQFRRQTTRYSKPKGSFSSNQGYLSVARDDQTGQFVSRQKLSPSTLDKLRKALRV